MRVGSVPCVTRRDGRVSKVRRAGQKRNEDDMEEDRGREGREGVKQSRGKKKRVSSSEQLPLNKMMPCRNPFPFSIQGH